MKADDPIPKTIDEYIAGFPRPVQTVLRRVRSAIRKGVPGAEEAIAYRMPTFKVGGRYVIYFAGWKAHYSLYPSTDRLVSVFKNDLAPYEVNGKGTIRFPLSEPVPSELIAALARFRAKEVAERALANAGVARSATSRERRRQPVRRRA